MLSISFSARFKKDLERELKDPRNKSLKRELEEMISLLAEGVPLPRIFHEHQLAGNYAGHFEAHIRPDLLIIYKVDINLGVILIRLGSHADLF